MNGLDLKRLEEAVKLLENPGWIAKITKMIGMPIDWAIKKLPKGASSMITEATEKAITKALPNPDLEKIDESSHPDLERFFLN